MKRHLYRDGRQVTALKCLSACKSRNACPVLAEVYQLKVPLSYPVSWLNEGLASRFEVQSAGWPASQPASGQVRQLASQSEDANLVIDYLALHPLVPLTLK